MTAGDRRYTLREAADLTGTSIGTLRRRCKEGKQPGAGKDPADPTGAWCIPALTPGCRTGSGQPGSGRWRS